MAFLQEVKDIHDAYLAAEKEADIWRRDYAEYERLADNGLLKDLDITLPEVNDGTLAAALFKLPKRIVSTKLRGRAKALHTEDEWKTELATMQWENHIVPNANMQAPFHRKWKDIVRKAAIFGGQPIVNLFCSSGDYEGPDFIAPWAPDVKLEAGKVSDLDSDIVFWDVYYTKLHVENMRDEAKEDEKEDPKSKKPVSVPTDGDNDEDDKPFTAYNIWHVDVLEEIIKNAEEDERNGIEEAEQKLEKGVKKSGFHFYIAYQRGVNAPFKMIHKPTRQIVREWSNPDPTGDIPVHYLYCYQDFINPYGIGICKLAGGTQNVLDYMRQADVLATQLGLRPPKLIEGDDSQTDYDSLTTITEDGLMIAGNAKVTPWNMADGVYNELPNRIQMYKSSLNQLIPTGDTSVSAGADQANQSKTPKGVQFQQQNLSIDDEDFKDNFYLTYSAVAKSMLNIYFANMEGKDTLTFDSDQVQVLQKAGFQVETNPDGTLKQEVQIDWEEARGTFDFIVDPSSDAFTDDEQQIEILNTILPQINLQTMWMMGQDGYKFNSGEAYYQLFQLMNLNNFSKIMTKMTAEEAQEAKQQPFPIIDHPQLRLTGQIPAAAMPAALAQGGVAVPPNTPLDEDAPDLAAVLKDPSTTVYEKAQIKQRMGIQPDPNAQNPVHEGPQGPNPVELDQKQQDINLRAQQLELDKAKLQLQAHQQGHTQGMEQVKFMHEAANGQQPQTTPDGKVIPPAPQQPVNLPMEHPSPLNDPQHQANVQAVMEQYHVPENIANAMLAAEKQGLPIDQILAQFVGGNQ